jgi:FtsP/CotA-like multicopper oxidase with cupredoxin domain
MLLGGCVGLAGLASNVLALSVGPQSAHASKTSDDTMSGMAGMSDMSNMASNASLGLVASMVGLPYQQGDVDPKVNGFDPLNMMTEFDMGKVSKLPSGQTVRDYTLTATNKNIFLAPGVMLPALVYNGRLPGPYLRATQGDHIRITFTNMCDIAHSINFAGLQPSNPNGKIQDVTFKPVPRNSQIVYEFDATQFGVYMY